MKWDDKKPYIYGMFAGFGAIALSVLLFFVLYRHNEFSGTLRQFSGILSPFVFGAAIAYLLKPMCNRYDAWLQHHLPARMKRAATPLAVAGSLVTAMLLVYLLFSMLIPQIIDSILTLVNTLPGQVTRFITWAQALPEQNSRLSELLASSGEDLTAMLDEWTKGTLVPYLKQIAGGLGTGVLSVVSLLKNLFIGIVVAVYLLLARHKYSRQARLVLYSAVKRPWADRIMEELDYADRMFEGFINGKLLDSAIIGIICYVFNCIAGLHNAMLIAVIIGVTNFVPFFGPFIGAVPSIFLILIDDPVKALWFTVFIIVLQQVDGNIIGPRILGNTTGVSSFWVLFAILLFGGLWGFVGMVIAVPLFAVVYDVLRKLIFRGLHRNDCDDMVMAYHRKFGTPPSKKELKLPRMPKHK